MPSELLETILGWVAAHPGWMGFFIFVTAMSEAVALFGLLVPGAMLMFGFGALISLGYLEFWPAYAWAATGGLLGDCASFWMGRFFHQQLRRLWPFSRHPDMLARSEIFFQRHGGKSLLLGRFFGPVRGVIPAVAGMLDLSFCRFLLVSTIAVILWAPAYLLPGVVFGASLELASQVAFRLVVLILLLIVLLWLTVHLVLWLFRFMHPRFRAWWQAYYDWSHDRPVLGYVNASLLDPAQKEWRALAVVALALLSGAIVVAFVLNAVDRELPTPLDRSLYRFLQDLRTPLADSLMVYITELADSPVKLVLATAVFLWLYWRRAYSAAFHWLIALGFTVSTTELLKWIFGVERPMEMYRSISSYAFPSNHAAMSTVLFGFLAVLIARETAWERRWIPYLGAALVVIPIAFSRLYLGAHWLSDILAGVSLGLVWVSLVGLTYNRRSSRPVNRGGLLAVSVASILVSGIIYSGFYHELNLHRYQLHPQLQILTQEQWWQEAWRRLPHQRIDFRGEWQDPLSIQWAISRSDLEKRLENAGWHRAPVFTAQSTLMFLNPNASIEQVPVLPRVHDGRHEEVALIRPGEAPDTRLVLRFWDSGMRIENGGIPIWLGSLSRQELQRRMNFFAFAKDVANPPVAKDRLDGAWQGLRTRLVTPRDHSHHVMLVAD